MSGRPCKLTISELLILITWQKMVGENTIALATAYSRNVVAPSLGNTTEKLIFITIPLPLSQVENCIKMVGIFIILVKFTLICI